MKNLFFVLFCLMTFSVFAQDDDAQMYLHFQWVSVDNEQEYAYAHTEDFWSKIHQERANMGDIVGWDLWSLQPHGEKQSSQYLIVEVYSDPVKMMDGSAWKNLYKAAEAAYPEMSSYDLMTKMRKSSHTRDLAYDQYCVLLGGTDSDFEMEEGTVSRINFMKVEEGNREAYESAEMNVFLPMHQKSANEGRRGSWGLASVMVPWGTDVHANYLTFDMYTDYAQMFSENDGMDEPSADLQAKMNEAIALRELKWGVMGTLVKKVRKQ